MLLEGEMETRPIVSVPPGCWDSGSVGWVVRGNEDDWVLGLRFVGSVFQRVLGGVWEFGVVCVYTTNIVLDI